VWATLLSLQHRGEETCAVVSAPALGRRWWAARGQGAWNSDGALRVSSVATLDQATLSVTDVRDFARHGWAEGFARLAGACRIVRGFGDFWSHVLVAEGAIDCGVEPVVNEWDISAARLIVREAGGSFSDFTGADRCDGGNVVTSNGLLHAQVLEVLRHPDRTRANVPDPYAG
jgi:histidinol-phosphatase